MLQEPTPQQYELEMVTMEQLVPKDHLVRKIDNAIDFEFIRDEVAHLYCKDNGRPPVDPVRLFKIILLGYIFGIKSERQLVKEIEVNVAYRWFLRMSLTEKVIHASTLSQNRIRRFNGTDVFERIFINIVEQAMTKGLVAGQELFTDSTHLKANANKNKHTNKVTAVRASAYLDMLDDDGVFGYRRPSRTKNAFKKKHFTYDAQRDSYQCPNGQVLLYKTTSRDAYREYHSDPKECAFCPMRDDCTQSKNMKKVITRHIYSDAVERANQMRLSSYGKKTYRRRSETVERSFADAKQHHGHRYARFRGLANVQMQCWLAAAAQNIKKIALVVNYLRKMGLNMAEIRQILASVYPCNEWKLLRTI
ncbi:transposase [Vibrio vulnificus]|nr:transposase [Vibrio vulnificus]